MSHTVLTLMYRGTSMYNGAYGMTSSLGSLANEEVGNLQEAVQLQNSRGRTLPGDSDGSDDNESNSNRSDGDGSDSEGGDGDDVLSNVLSMEPPPSNDRDQYR